MCVKWQYPNQVTGKAGPLGHTSSVWGGYLKAEGCPLLKAVKGEKSERKAAAG